MNIEYVNGEKMFKDSADRITTAEKNLLYSYFVVNTGHLFKKMGTPYCFSAKKTHGDLDVIVVPRYYDWVQQFHDYLGDFLLMYSQNDNCHSHLIKSEFFNKNIHVDIITTFRSPLFSTMLHFYRYNDVSAIIGIIAKRLHFRYGTRGFYKRYKDSKGTIHSILVSLDLNVGLKCLGFCPQEFMQIHDMHNALNFVMSTPFFDYRFFTEEEMNNKDKRDLKRKNIRYMYEHIRETKVRNDKSIDENFFLKTLYPDLFERVNRKIGYIEKALNQKKLYDGDWIMNRFKLSPSPIVGNIKKAILDQYGFQYSLIPEKEMATFVENFIKEKI